MRHRTHWLSVCALATLLITSAILIADEPTGEPGSGEPASGEPASAGGSAADLTSHPHPAKLPDFLVKGVDWLIAAQHPDGGWGGGSHADQQNRDPHKVQTDPATTAFTLLSLLRSGHTPVAGQYKDHVRRGLEYLTATVEKAPSEGPRITDITGTQPQSKLGQNVDTALTAQYLARAVSILEKSDPLYDRVDKALDKCLDKLQASQKEDGSWGEGGWAPVLQSSLGCSALEVAQANGKYVDDKKLALARRYQQSQVDVTGDRAVVTPAGAAASAGVQLYAFNGALRGGAAETREAKRAIEIAKEEGKLGASAPVSGENLRIAGIEADKADRLAAAAQKADAQFRRLDDEQLLAGFGNNGGEEFLSYLLTSESLCITGGDKFQQWNDKIHGRLQKVQNADGSWSGHHCITSPVFCTAAVVQCLTTDRDAEFLVAMAERTKTPAKEDDLASAATPNLPQ